ncbi:MAG: LysE family translocator [Phormidesmis sp.]
MEGFASALGTLVGDMFHVIAAALGISAVLAASAVAFNLVKYLGAAYLIYIGVKTILSRDEPFVQPSTHQNTVSTTSYRKAFLQGVTIEVLNPKTALFFLAFIPQFVDPSGVVFAQFLLFGTLTVLLNAGTGFVVMALAGPIGKKLSASLRLRVRQRFMTGTGVIALGSYVAFARESEL